ncbi:MAG TPA: amidohydrolase family protein [Verrucomicrobiae bacterium]|nr:amidohydrolase family protein [Verrucomicrobiae bacterium]
MKLLKPKPPSAARRRKILFAGMLVTVFLWNYLLARPFRPVEPIPAGIVDMHCHLAGIGAGDSGCFVSPRLRDNWRFGIYLCAFGVSREGIAGQGDRLLADRLSESLAQSKYVSKAVLLALDGVIDADGRLDTNRTEVYFPDEYVADVCARHTNLLFGASVNPYRPDALARLEWAKNHGGVLVKWIPPIMEINPDDPKLVPFYKKMVELNLPLLSHTGEEKSFSRANENFGDPEKLRLPLSLGVTVIAAHIASSEKYAGQRGPDRLAALMREYPNLYTDISALTQINKPGCMKEALTKPEFSGREVYGTDFPLIHTALVSPWYSFHLSLRQKIEIWRTKNPWDRDVLTKHYLGVPTETFARSGQMFGKLD